MSGSSASPTRHTEIIRRSATYVVTVMKRLVLQENTDSGRRADSSVSAGDHRTQSSASHDTAPARKITLLSETLRKVAVASAAAKKLASITKGPSRKGMSVVMDMEVQSNLASTRHIFRSVTNMCISLQ